jgi:hypothetical protein
MVMASAADHVRLSELFEALEGPAAAMMEALEVHSPERGRLARSGSMLASVMAKLKAELEHRAWRELDPELRKAEVTMFAGPADHRQSARDLVLAIHADKR